jgi:hypothetical protein
MNDLSGFDKPLPRCDLGLRLIGADSDLSEVTPVMETYSGLFIEGRNSSHPLIFAKKYVDKVLWPQGCTTVVSSK